MIRRHLQALSVCLALLGSAACLPQLWPEPSTAHRSGVASVSILAWSDSVVVGYIAILTFELHPPPGQTPPVSVTVSWASSDTSVATVDDGDVLGKRVGVATISLTANGV